MDVIQKLKKIKAEYGDWTAHAIRLSDGIYTMEQYNENHFLYLNRITQIAKDIFGGSLNGKRVLDLACLEGGFAVEFALCGADVVAVEGRKRNLAKLDFASAALQLSNIRTILSDVRKISVEEYGIFDCVLCLGILYHLDGESIGAFLKNIYQMTSRVLIIDTHVSLYGGEYIEIDGVNYSGATFVEHQETDTPDIIEASNWASLDNKKSFVFTFASLANLLKNIGFTSVYTCEMPYYNIMADRRTIVAIKGDPHRLLSFDRDLSISDVYPEKSLARVLTPMNEIRAEEASKTPKRESLSLHLIIRLFLDWIRQLIRGRKL